MKETKFTSDEINQFKSCLSQESYGHNRKLTGEQMSKLKKSHFNEYIKKIKYYAQKDIEKIKGNNVKRFYETNGYKNYENKEEATLILKKQKPIIPPQIHQLSYYYYGKAQISSMKEFIFLAEECHRIQQNIQKVIERKRNNKFVKNVQKIVQQSQNSNQSSSKKLNLHLTLKSARQIEQKIRQKRIFFSKLPHTARTSYQSAPKSFGSTNFSSIKSSSTASLRVNAFKK